MNLKNNPKIVKKTFIYQKRKKKKIREKKSINKIL